jgi:hypothetical protein
VPAVPTTEDQPAGTLSVSTGQRTTDQLPTNEVA